MSGPSRPIADDELVELLQGRARQAKVDPALIGRVAAKAAQSPQRGLGWWPAALRSFAPARGASASRVAVVAIVSLVGAALFVGGGSRPSVLPSPSDSGLVSGPTQRITAYRFTSVDFLSYLRQQPDAFVGHTILVDGSLGDIMASCVRQSFDCPPQAFGNAQPDDPLVIPADQFARDSVGEGRSGTFAIDVRSAKELALVGAVRLSPAGEIWHPSELDLRETTRELYAVDGYLAASDTPLPCPVDVSGGMWCPPTWIADELDPTSHGVGPIPHGAIQVPAGSADAIGMTPLTGHGLFLLKRATTDAGICVDGASSPPAGCAAWSRWTVVGSLDPVALSVPSASPTPEPPHPVAPEPVVLSEADLQRAFDEGGESHDGKVLLVHGTLVAMSWCKAVDCPAAAFESLPRSGGVSVEAGGDMPSLPVSGTFAVRVLHSHVVQYVDRVVPNGDHISWRPLELARYGPPDGTAYVVTGWLVPGEASTCPRAPDDSAACDVRPPQLVEDEATARTLLGGQKVESLLLTSVAAGVELADAQPGTYVVRTATIPPCGPNADCFIPPNAPVGLFVDARVDPSGAVFPSPSASNPVASTDPTTGVAPPPAVTWSRTDPTPFSGPDQAMISDVMPSRWTGVRSLDFRA